MVDLPPMNEKQEAIIIRPAQIEDSPRLADLCRQLGYPAEEHEIRRRLDGLLADPIHALLVAETTPGVVVGWVHGYLRRLLIADRYVELGGLVVDAAYRGRGIGRMLMERMEEWAKAQGAGMIYLRSNVIREQAHRFYRQIGYEQIKTSLTFTKSL